MSSILGLENYIDGSDLSRDNTRGAADWLGRKILLMTRAFWSAVVETTQFLVQAFFGANRQNEVSESESRIVATRSQVQPGDQGLVDLIYREIHTHLTINLLVGTSTTPLSIVNRYTLTISETGNGLQPETTYNYFFDQGPDNTPGRLNEIMKLIRDRLNLRNNRNEIPSSMTVKVTLGESHVLIGFDIGEDGVLRIKNEQANITYRRS